MYMLNLLNFLQNVLTEKVLVFGEDIFSLLNKIEHPIADFLISLKNTADIDTDFVYIDIDKSEGLVSVKKDKNQEQYFKMKIGRVVTALIQKNNSDLNVSQRDIEQFVNMFKSEQEKLNKNLQFNVVSGEDIKKWYNEMTYTKGSNPLTKSCMGYESCQSFFTVYTDNKYVKMLILTNPDGKLEGRAILWENVLLKNLNKRITFMDRIYYSTDHIVELFKDYAKNNNIWFKTEQSPIVHKISNGVITLEEPKLYAYLPTTIDWTDHNKIKVPFMDTLKIFAYDKKTGKKIPILTSDDNIEPIERWTEMEGYPEDYDEYRNIVNDDKYDLDWDNDEIDMDDLMNHSQRESYVFKHLKGFDKF